MDLEVLRLGGAVGGGLEGGVMGLEGLGRIESFGSDGLRPSATQNSGHGPSNNQQKMKTLEKDWTHPPKAIDLYHTSNPDLEPTGKEKARPLKKQLGLRSGS